MKANQADFPVSVMCRVLGVSTSGYYGWLNRSPSSRAQSNSELSDKIVEIHRASRQTYGSPRITAELREVGHEVGQTESHAS